MIDDMMKIVLDPVLTPKNAQTEDNGFELLYREEQAGQGPAVNMRRPFSQDLVYPIPELKPFIGKKSNVKNPPAIPVRGLKPKIEGMSANKSP